MINLSFTQSEMQTLRTLLDIGPGKQPTARDVLRVLAEGAEGLELSQGCGKNPLLDTMRRRAHAATVAAMNAP